ncbi:DUF2577 domain-containing protein [Paenibacillus pinihumi]|uniref:DUF2577 domain-containing protein n=1 Tax=Paenibacillus pinihumi TaxID=669462 RepID=UPI00048B056F|nr:DUF2577 domain-containing protein [Paenibacillus pinihumi]
MGLVDIIKQIGTGAVDAQNPVTIVYGSVIQGNPLEINVDQRLKLHSAFLVVPESLSESKILIGNEEYVIRKGLEPGDRVVLIRVQGGQSYLVLDRVVT